MRERERERLIKITPQNSGKGSGIGNIIIGKMGLSPYLKKKKKLAQYFYFETIKHHVFILKT